MTLIHKTLLMSRNGLLGCSGLNPNFASWTGCLDKGAACHSPICFCWFSKFGDSSFHIISRADPEVSICSPNPMKKSWGLELATVANLCCNFIIKFGRLNQQNHGPLVFFNCWDLSLARKPYAGAILRIFDSISYWCCGTCTFCSSLECMDSPLGCSAVFETDFWRLTICSSFPCRLRPNDSARNLSQVPSSYNPYPFFQRHSFQIRDTTNTSHPFPSTRSPCFHLL